MISCGMRRLYGEHALIKGSDGASPMANTRNVISDDVDLRVIWGKLAYLCRNSADTHRKTIVLFVFRIITSPLSKISDLFVFRASCFSSLPGDKKLASIVKYPLKARRKVCLGAFKSRSKLLFPVEICFCAAQLLARAGPSRLGHPWIG